MHIKYVYELTNHFIFFPAGEKPAGEGIKAATMKYMLKNQKYQ